MLKGAFKKINFFTCSERGLALVVVLVFTLLIFASGAVLLEVALKENLVAGYHTGDIKQHYLAEAGLEAGLYCLNSGAPPLGDLNFTLEGGQVNLQLKAGNLPETYTITATGLTDKGSTTLVAEASLDEEGCYEVQKWLKAKGGN